MARPLVVGFLVSGEGTTLEGVAERLRHQGLPVRIGLVVSDRPGVQALERARRLGLEVAVVPTRGVEPERWSHELSQELEARGVELVVLAGFLSILPASWVARWAGRAVNLHPSLLPRHGGPGMWGPKVHRAVLAAGEPETGATVHLVTRDVDGGPTIAQERLEVRPDDTETSLRARLHPVEVELLAATLGRFATGELPLPSPEPKRPGRSSGEGTGLGA